MNAQYQKVALITGASQGLGAGMVDAYGKRQGGGGHIVTITTSLVDNADSRVPSALASLTKGGLQSVTKSLAIEYAVTGEILHVDGGMSAGH